MIRKGDTIHNPVTGERVTFLTTSAETDGEYVVVEVAVEPNGFVASKHVHPHQSERFEVVAGELEFTLGREKIVARAGDVLMIEPGTPHRFRNIGDTEARFVTEVRPALQFEQLLDTMFALARDGRTNRKGMPNPFRLAVIARAHFDDVRLPVIPVAMQRAALAMGSPLGRMLRYEPTYESAPAMAALGEI